MNCITKCMTIFLALLLFPLTGHSRYEVEIPAEKKIEEGLFGPDVKYVTISSRNTDVDAAEDIVAEGGDYAGFAASAETFEVYTDSANDTLAGTGAQKVRLYYLDSDKNCFDSAGDWLTQDVDMNGGGAGSGAISATAGTRLWKAEVIQSGSGETNAGTITIRHSTTTSNIFGIIRPSTSKTQGSNFTICEGYTGYLERLELSLLDNTANNAEIVTKTQTEEGTSKDGCTHGVSTQFVHSDDSLYGFVIPEKNDFWVRVKAIQNANGNIAAEYRIRLVKD